MKRLMMVISLITFLLLTIQAVRAAGDASYTLDWWTVDNGGGGTSQNGSYVLTGTVGQVEPGALHGGEYSLVGGFWAVLQEAWKEVFLPILLKP